MKNIAVVVPSIRPKSLEKFMEAWAPLFDKHGVHWVEVLDGKKPTVNGLTAGEVMGEYADCLTNFNAGIRNLGFAFVLKSLKGIDYVLTLDDDEVPIGDPIQDHYDALQMRVPVSWVSTASEYTRGFPYAVRKEAEVVLSHGVWEGVADWDAPTQLTQGNHPIEFPKMAIPKGVFYPMCSMNLAFKRKMIPYIFHAPWALGIHRFDDIFAGVESKREIDAHGWAAVTGYARVNHQRESNVFTNLQHEALGIFLNETFWQGDEEHPYFKIYREKYARWREWCKKYE